MSGSTQVSASTQVYGVIGHPIAHSLSPRIHNAVFREFGMDAVYLAFDVAPESLTLAVESMRSLGIRGLNVTIPHKEDAVNCVDEIPEDLDRCMGAINTIVNRAGKLYGYNTDRPGFLAALGEELSFKPEGKTVLVLGAGGSARGVSFALASSGADRLLIYNRTHERAEGLSDLLSGHFSQLEAEPLRTLDAIGREKIDLVVNATSCGMRPDDPLPVDLNLLNPETRVYDLIYSPLETRLLSFAKTRGMKYANGLGMLAAQAAYSFSLWTGRVDGVREIMMSVLRTLCTK